MRADLEGRPLILISLTVRNNQLYLKRLFSAEYSGGCAKEKIHGMMKEERDNHLINQTSQIRCMSAG